MIERRIRKAISMVMATALATASLPVREIAQARELSRTEYEACQAGDDEAFRAAVQRITATALATGIDRVDFRAVVENEWRKVGMSELIDQRVDIAIEGLKQETSWSQRIKSLAYSEVSQNLAKEAAERVYRSDAFKSALDRLATGVGKDVSSAIEIATLDTARPAQDCIRAFLSGRYGAAVSGAVATEAGKEFHLDKQQGTAGVTSGSMAQQTSEGIAGAVILLVRRRLATMASRLGQRLVGSVLGRLVSIVAGGVGLALIAKDIWDLRNGVIPIISTEMKSKETKEKVKLELAKTISDQIKQQSEEIASGTADRIVDIWREFRRGHAKVLELADKNAAFRRFLDRTRASDLARLDEVVALLLPREGEKGILARLENGTLQRSVTELPETGMQIARDTQSIERAMLWQALAGSDLLKVTALGLHKRSVPQDFTRSGLSRLLALDDEIVITRLAEVPSEARVSLFEIGDQNLLKLARSLGAGELATLSGYLTGLEAGARKQVLTAVAETPARMRVLAVPRVRDAVLSSRDQKAAVTMMLMSPPVFDLAILQRHMNMVLEGRVSPILLWEKHPIAIVTGVLLLLMLLLILRRLTSRRRPSKAASPL